MGNRNTTGLLGVIIEVCLSKLVGVVTDDLDGVLICTYGTVCAETPELTSGGACRSGNRIFGNFERKIGNVINDTDGKGLLLGVLEYGNNLSRGGVLGT